MDLFLAACLLLWILPALGGNEESLRRLLAADPRDILRNIPANSGISKLCYDRIQYILRENGTNGWSQRLFNSWGKPNIESNSGHQYYLGDFEGCQSIQNITDDDKTTFKSRYCLTNLISSVSHSDNVASCVPFLCTAADVINIYKKSNIADANLQRSLKVTSKCRNKEQKLPKANFKLLWVPLVVIIISVAATFYDLALLVLTGNGSCCTGKLNRTIIAFSLYSNIRAKLQTSQPPDSITCLHGMRVFSFTWVALNHIAARIMYMVPKVNPSFVPIFHKSLLLSPTLKAHIAVNSFFTISGILAAYTLLRQYHKNRPDVVGFIKSLPLSYLHRYLRLTPAYAFLIIINWKLVCYLYDGPFWWYDCKNYQSSCQKTWHYNMLYINNFKSGTGQCSTWGWYLANEMQFALVAPFVVYALHRSNIMGPVFCVMTILASVKASYYLSDLVNYQFINFNLARFAFKSRSVAEEWNYYFVPWQRYKSYGVGILTGYIIFRLKQHGKTIPKVVNTLLWFAAAGLCISVVFGPFPVSSGQRIATLYESNMYNTFSGVAWSIGINCVVISCSLGSGGWINSFLSCRPFVILSNITYCAFLIHQPVSQMMIYGRRYVPTLTTYSLYKETYMCIAVSCVVGFFFSVLFELPFAHLVSIYLSPSSRTTSLLPRSKEKEKLINVEISK